MIKVQLDNLVYRKSKQEGRVISLPVVSKETGIDMRTLKSYQAGEVKFYTLKTIDKLCEYFGCQVGDVLHMK